MAEGNIEHTVTETLTYKPDKTSYLAPNGISPSFGTSEGGTVVTFTGTFVGEVLLVSINGNDCIVDPDPTLTNAT